jgi:hypothetical protein
MNPGCVEQLPDLEFLRWIWSYPRKELPRVLELLREHEGRKTIVILRSTAEIEGYVAAVSEDVTRADRRDQALA